MNTSLYWLTAALLLFIIEILTPGVFFFACLSIGALVAALVSALGVGSIAVQCVVFGIVSVAAVYFIKPLLRRLFVPAPVPSNVDQVVGASAVVLETIDGNRTAGSVRLRGEVWRAVTEAGRRIEPGAEVSVVAVDGTHLVVK